MKDYYSSFIYSIFDQCMEVSLHQIFNFISLAVWMHEFNFVYHHDAAGQRCCDLPSSSSTGLTSPPQLMQCGNRNWLRGDEKGYKMVVDEGSPCNRRWEDMDHEILIYIFKRYPWHIWFWRGFYICKSWLSAFLDYLFPPGQVCDLRFLDGPELLLFVKSMSLNLLNILY